jgi:hypothetical protein
MWFRVETRRAAENVWEFTMLSREKHTIRTSPDSDDAWAFGYSERGNV